MRRVYGIGDLVRIKDGVNDPRISPTRVGLVAGIRNYDTRRDPGDPFFYDVLICGSGQSLVFHEMWIADADPLTGPESPLEPSESLEDLSCPGNHRSPPEGSESL